ncbi:sensor histidine kinase [Rhizobium sp. SSA_523]|uniref:sensor histidine kinase n=1 Tax=Rhizobium sp. SSA_523 TaxID=2952477 RepID=UPI0020907313|nr:sensor histidine kinase [Rhizobium sp. SSA_523]MCO5731617.1 sensor histidine kinase [Rhizobium sp. SSA_523]WKC22566.1 sensor histidine kinase [Rhizobium sp. SSA_523]
MLVVSVVVSSAAVMFYGTSLMRSSFMEEASLQAGSTLRLAVAALDGHLKRYEPLPRLIADHENIEELLSQPQDPGLRLAANRYLKMINTLLDSSDIYVIDMTGDTIAASNFEGPASFVGQNFSYRPYFQEAAQGRPARFYALGTTSAKRGYYFSAPVEVGGSILGVIVFKVDIDVIEATWQGGEYKIFVSDPEGIIFMSGNPDWLYKSLLALTEERLARTTASRRYSDARLEELPVRRHTLDGYDLMDVQSEGTSREYLVLSEYVETADWTVNVLTDTTSVHAQARTTVIAIVLSLCLAGMALAVVLQRKARRDQWLAMEIERKAELERRVEERTADLARVNLQLRQTQADLIQAGKLAGLGQMSAALSHEFNQPLAAVKNYADSATLLIERGRAPEARDNLARISSLIDRMASLSRHLRNFARKPNEKLGPVALADVLNDTLEIVAARLATADASLTLDLGAVPPVVNAGSVRLQQVLVNIITNAADAVEGLDDRAISLTARATGGRAVIEVRDHGPGVPPAIAERIFDPFFTTKGPGKGLGLGLSISYNIVKDFGGDLTVSHHPEGGAVFRIDLALADALSEAAE